LSNSILLKLKKGRDAANPPVIYTFILLHLYTFYTFNTFYTFIFLYKLIITGIYLDLIIYIHPNFPIKLSQHTLQGLAHACAFLRMRTPSHANLACELACEPWNASLACEPRMRAAYISLQHSPHSRLEPIQTLEQIDQRKPSLDLSNSDSSVIFFKKMQ